MRPTRPLAVAVLTAVLTLSACSSGGDSDDGGGGTSADVAGEAPVPADADEASRRGLQDGLDNANVTTDPDSGAQEPTKKAVISTGNVQLISDDVEKAVFDVQALVDEYAGEITDRETGTDDEGEVRTARLVVRIPAKDFDAAFIDLEKVADLRKSTSTSEDVTTQVIDNRVRIRAQRRSLRRVEVLLDRALSIRDIVSIEAQLTRRQADLDSLEQQQAYLQDQTTLSTITVNIQRTEDEPAKKKEKDDAGFLAGLDAGLKALVVFGTGLATIAGALLPWAIVLLVLGGPLWLLLRRLRRRSEVVPDVPAPSGTE
jgi:hypothetical protein